MDGYQIRSKKKYCQINCLHTITIIDFQVLINSTHLNGKEKQNVGGTILKTYYLRNNKSKSNIIVIIMNTCMCDSIWNSTCKEHGEKGLRRRLFKPQEHNFKFQLNRSNLLINRVLRIHVVTIFSITWRWTTANKNKNSATTHYSHIRRFVHCAPLIEQKDKHYLQKGVNIRRTNVSAVQRSSFLARKQCQSCRT